MALQMTREEYERIYGIAPSMTSTSTIDTKPAPIRMTREEYNSIFGESEEKPSGLGTQLMDRTSKFGSDIVKEQRGLGGRALRTAGFLAGGVADIASAVISPVINKTADVISENESIQRIANTKPVSKGLDTVDKIGEKVTKGMDTLEEYDPSLAQDVRDVANIASVLPLGKPSAVVKGKAGQARTAINKANSGAITANIEKELFDIENNYAKTRNANDYSKDSGASSRKRIAETDVLYNAVDAEGTIRTKQPGGAIDQYKSQTIEGVENVVRENLKRNAETITLPEVKLALLREVSNAGLEGADLVTALKGVERELAGLQKRAQKDVLQIEKLHDAKISTTNNINYATPPETATYRKAVARGYRKLIEEKSTKFDVKSVNAELSKYYDDIARLERLDGKKVKGGRLGKYFAQISGNLIGGAAGSIAGPAGMAVGSIVGGEAASFIKGRTMASTFGGKRGAVAPKNAILEQARLNIPDKPIAIPEGIKKTPELESIEKDIKKNVEQQDKAIAQAKKTGDFSAVQALKDIYVLLVEELKKLLNEIKTNQGGSVSFFGKRDQSYSRGKRNTQYQATNAQNKTVSIDSKVSQDVESVFRPGDSENLAKAFIKTEPPHGLLEDLKKFADYHDGYGVPEKGMDKLKYEKMIRDELDKHGVPSYDMNNKQIANFADEVAKQADEVPQMRDAVGRFASKDPLTQEALKYKSAEEFVKAQSAIYHGTPNKFTKFAKDKMYGGRAWFSDSKKAVEGNDVEASRPAGSQWNVMERFIKPDIKIADRNIPEIKKLVDNEYTDSLIAKGYRGIKHEADAKRGSYVELFFPNEDTLTKSQLTDIYNKAHGKK